MKCSNPIVLRGLALLLSVALIAGCGDDDNPVTDKNNSPVIDSLTSSETAMDIASTCTITCFATDPDGDSLTYAWSADAGSVSGTGSSITWTSPDVEGACIVECEVSDVHGASATDSVSIMVEAVQSWRIVFEDNFDGATLNASDWTQISESPPPYSLTGSGELEIEGGSGQNGAAFLCNTVVSGDYVRVKSKFRTTQGDPDQDFVEVGIVLNAHPAGGGLNSGYYISLISEEAGNSRNYGILVVKILDGEFSLLFLESIAGTMPQISGDNDYILEAANSNGLITLAVKDESGTVIDSMSIEDSSLSGGQISMFGASYIATVGPQSIFFDYVIVEKYE